MALDPNLGEAWIAKGYYEYGCVGDFESAARYYEQARQLLPNSSLVRLVPRLRRTRSGAMGTKRILLQGSRTARPAQSGSAHSPRAILYHAASFPRSAPEARPKSWILCPTTSMPWWKREPLRKPKAICREPRPSRSSRAGGRRSDGLGTFIKLFSSAARPNDFAVKGDTSRARSGVGYLNGELRFWLGWAQEIAGDQPPPRKPGERPAPNWKLFSKNNRKIGLSFDDLALITMGLGDKAAALTLVERAMAVHPIEKDAANGPQSIEILARVAARLGEPDRAIAALQKILSMPGNGGTGHRHAANTCPPPARSDVRSAPERSAFPKARRDSSSPK